MRFLLIWMFTICELLHVSSSNASSSSASISSASSSTAYHNEQSDIKTVAVQLRTNNITEAKSIAARHNLKFLTQVGDLSGLYSFGYRNHTNRHKRQIDSGIENDNEIVWFEPQKVLDRVKRASYQMSDFNDPMIPDLWFMSGKNGANTMKIQEAWKLGYTGQGVHVTVMDDGIQTNHPDLADNYDRLCSWDYNDNDPNPMPHTDGDNYHGTRCASVIASVENNNFCTVGVAFRASIGAIRMIDGAVTDVVEASSFGHRQQHIDIYSASWGPRDDGRGYDGPSLLALKAIRKGIFKGRGGKGNIYVWATGNGNHNGDSCAFDGYLSSIYTVAATATTYGNRQTYYSEKCASIICVSYSSGHSSLDPSIPAADKQADCTKVFSGTSASAPMVAGVIALMLQANPQLTWRDVQHVLIRTSNADVFGRTGRWKRNGAGRKVSDTFGYGLVDAEAAVRLARSWRRVPKANACKVLFNINRNQRELSGRSFTQSYSLVIGNECAQVRYVEHVQVILDVPSILRRGAVEMRVKSPSGTTSTIMPARKNDDYSGDLRHSTQWPFLSRQQWGETSQGKWTLTIKGKDHYNEGSP